jgi:hypothetical protein
MSNKHNEIDSGSPYVLIEKLERRLVKAETAIIKLVSMNMELKQEVAGMKQNVRESSQISKKALVVASRVDSDIVASVSKVATHRKRKAKDDPFYHKWIEHIKKNFVSVKYVDEKDMKKGEAFGTLEVRKELAEHFGNHILDSEFITGHALARVVKDAGFVVSQYTISHWYYDDKDELRERKYKPFLMKKKPTQ